MKNKNFFYLQYDKIDWKNQEKTKINSLINNIIIQKIIKKHKDDNIAIFDMGFGIGFFIEQLLNKIKKNYKNIIIEGCEPSKVNYDYWAGKTDKLTTQNININTSQKTFQDIETQTKFDFVTAIYVFPHFLTEDLESVVKKIHSMLKDEGKFILALANEEYLEDKLKKVKDLSIETKHFLYDGKKYKEILHYSDIPEIGKLIDINREEAYYIDLFKDNNFTLKHKENIDDNGFICTLFVFEKKKTNLISKVRKLLFINH